MNTVVSSNPVHDFSFGILWGWICKICSSIYHVDNLAGIQSSILADIGQERFLRGFKFVIIFRLDPTLLSTGG